MLQIYPVVLETLREARHGSAGHASEHSIDVEHSSEQVDVNTRVKEGDHRILHG